MVLTPAHIYSSNHILEPCIEAIEAHFFYKKKQQMCFSLKNTRKQVFLKIEPHSLGRKLAFMASVAVSKV